VRPPWSTIATFLRGVAMGAADVVPGVSGGTMALVLGVYERLVKALRAVTGSAPWRALRRGGLREALRAADAGFLLPLVAGIAVAVLSLAHVIQVALVEQRVLLYAGFTGLVAASVVVVARQVRDRRPVTLLVAAGATVATFVLLGLPPAAAPTETYFLVVSGAVGICALVLPGVSGAFLLVLLGQYETVLAAITRLDLRVLAPFAAGAVVGLATIARVLDALLRRARALTLAALAGAMLGSLRRLWPWTRPFDADGVVGPPGVVAPDAPRTVPVWPSEALGPEGWATALIVAVAAAALVGVLEWTGARRHAGARVSRSS
jgi:putative membrane protein